LICALYSIIESGIHLARGKYNYYLAGGTIDLGNGRPYIQLRRAKFGKRGKRKGNWEPIIERRKEGAKGEWKKDPRS